MHRSGWLVLAFAAASVASAEPPRKVDITKRLVVERPVEAIVAELPPAEAEPAKAEVAPKDGDRTKRQVIERPVEEIVSDLPTAERAPLPASRSTAESDNPPVAPGKVKWHKDVAAAMAAAKKSGKPVLVFHLLGQLDQRFT